jgi:hypothetical protein
MSSIAREITGFLRLLQATSQLFPETVRNSTVQLVGDNQGAVQAINQFRSRAPDIAHALKGIFRLCVESGSSVTALWQPRDLLVAEDLFSRQPDASDWGVRKELFESICAEFHTTVAIDLFASDTWHVTPRFVSAIYTPGCLACQALLLDWRHFVENGKTAWIFPSVRVIPEVVQLIERYKTTCVLIVPEQKAANWWIRLFSRPLARNI